MSTDKIAYIALGSNLGDRKENLDRAVEMLRSQAGICVDKVSAYYETEPVGGPPGQGKYLNGAAELRTTLGPRALLDVLMQLEKDLGRVRQERDGPRTLDLDLLLYDNCWIDEPGLTIPHPRMHERRFVLEPLAELAPNAIHTVLGRTVRELLANRTPPPGRELTGKRTLITGSTSGIGRAIALELAAAGADVIVHGRKQDAADRVVEQVRRHNVQCGVQIADLARKADRDGLVQSVWSHWGGLDILVNNAGADTLTGTAANESFEQKLEALWSVDVQATIFLSRAIGAWMKTRGGGVIVNMGWDQAETGMEGDSGQLFAATKAAVMAFTKSLAVELAPEVRVNCLAPGWVRTAWGETASPRWQERVLRETPLGRWGTPEDVAAAVRWLVSPAAQFITGQVIRVNGGAVRS